MEQSHQEGRFKLVLTGSVDPRVPLQEAEQRLSELLKTTPDKVKRLLQGQPTALSKSLSATEAERYRLAIEKTGARCRLEPELISKPTSPAPPPVVTPKPPASLPPKTTSLAPAALTIEPIAPYRPPPTQSSSATTVCPYCKEAIQIEAAKCKHCGEWLDLSARPGEDGLDEMDAEELKSKGWSAITLWIFVSIFIGLISRLASIPEVSILQFPVLFLYFRGCYRYMKGKGYDGIFALIGIFSLVGALIMLYMPDKSQKRKYPNRRR